jgi:hypothetical protein
VLLKRALTPETPTRDDRASRSPTKNPSRSALREFHQHDVDGLAAIVDSSEVMYWLSSQVRHDDCPVADLGIVVRSGKKLQLRGKGLASFVPSVTLAHGAYRVIGRDPY